MIPGQQDRNLGTSLSFMGESETIIIIIKRTSSSIPHQRTLENLLVSPPLVPQSLSRYNQPKPPYTTPTILLSSIKTQPPASSQQFLIHHNQAFQTEPPKTDKHHTSCYCPLNETPLLSRISRAILGKVSP